MQNDSCSNLLDKVAWGDPGLIASLVVLGCIDVMVIVGNCLVIMAVFMSSKLRTVTNLFIVSLAVADLMVGVAVLPFSATWEVFSVWIFGDVWCSIWLAVDVWMCTASILNLCAISLDRYVAVTRPVSYPSIMSSKRAKLLIAGVWVLSFVICFPPLVGWNDQDESLLAGGEGNSSKFNFSGDWNESDYFLGTYLLTTTTTSSPYDAPIDPNCPWICELTNDAGYVVYSALGSFYIPMFVMLFFYWRIYRAAVQTTHAINQGFRTTKGSKVLGNRFEEQRLTLRIHRGRGSVMQHSRGEGRSPGCQRAHSSRRLERSRTQDRIKISVSYPGDNGTSKKGSSCKPTALYSVHYASNGGRETVVHKREDGKKSNSKFHLRVSSATRRSRCPKDPAETPLNSSPPPPSPSPTGAGTTTYDAISSSSEDNKPKLISKMGKRNIKAQVKRFRMETKAAKTLGIIVGGFILCWCPFFTMYLIRAFCPECIHPVVFSVLFWLGYCNSAINPCIYALFSKDFRFAFKKIICKCFCNRRKPRQAGVQNPAIYLSSLGDDSDGNNENGSDSR